MSVLRITDQSHSQTVALDAAVELYVTAQGDNLTYQWEGWTIFDEQTGQWVYGDLTGETSDEYSFTAASDDDGCHYRCAVSDGNTTIYSDEIIISISAAPTISTQPQSLTVAEGQTASFSIAASGFGTSYQWQVSSDGTTWSDINNATSDTYSFVAALPSSGLQYRCIVYNTLRTQSRTSSVATLTVTSGGTVTPPTITQQPSSVTVAEGNSATFTVAAIGNNLSYQWQTYRGETWYNIDGATSASYTEAGTVGLSGSKYHCIVTSTIGGASASTISQDATLTVTSSSTITTPAIGVQPNDITVRIGQTASFMIAATGGGIGYQWQVKNNNTWYDVTGATSASYAFIATMADNGKQYRCVVTNLAGTAISDTATLTVTEGTPMPTDGGITYYMVDGVDILPYIADGGIGWSRNDVDGDNAGRVIGNADMQRDRLAIKIRNDITCRSLSTVECRLILRLIKPEFVTVQFDDPMDGNVTKIMYSNNVSAKLGTVYDDGSGLWEGLAFPLIEK